MRIKTVLMCLFFQVSLFAGARISAAADGVSPEKPKTGCPDCKNDKTEIAQLLKAVDRLHAQFKPKEAAGELLKVLQLDARNFEALTKLARAYIDIGDMIPESSSEWQEKRIREYRTAEDYARKAVAVSPNSTWGHFYMAWSLGNIAMISPVTKQVDVAGEIRSAVERAIALDPQNGFAYHVYGVWHRKMAEIGNMSRMLASALLGRSIPEGTMEKSVEYLKRAIALNPTVIVSRLELAKTYIATEEWPQARNFLKSIESLPINFSDDSSHKHKAQQLLEEIKDR